MPLLEVLTDFKRASPGCLHATVTLAVGDDGRMWVGRVHGPNQLSFRSMWKCSLVHNNWLHTVPFGTLLPDVLKRIKWSSVLLKPCWKAHTKGRAFLAGKLVHLSSEDLQQIRLIALVGFTVLMSLRSDNWKAWLSLKWWQGHFQESLGERIR